MLHRINLATRTYLDRRKFNTIAGIACVVLILLLFFNITMVAGNAGKLSRMGKEIGLLSGKDTGSVPQKDYQEIVSRIKFANEIIAMKTFNWMSLLDALEAVVPDGVAISGVNPKPKTGDLGLSGAARSFTGLQQLMENLESSSYFRDIYLMSQSEISVGETQKGISFSINCKVNLK